MLINLAKRYLVLENQNLKRSIPFYIALWILLVYIYIEVFNIAEMICLILFFISIVALILGAMDKKPSVIIHAVFYFIYSFTVLNVGDFFRDQQYSETIVTGNRIVSCLDEYHTRNGIYPETLSSLVPSCLVRFPLSSFGILRKKKFFYETERSSFKLSFGYEGLLICDYKTRSRSWECRD
jgi:hypothetical protein